MKTKHVIFHFTACFILAFSGCQKERELSPSNLSDHSEGSITGNQAATIEIVNNTPTLLHLTINDIPANRSLNQNSAITISGEPGKPVKVTVQTTAKDATGNAIGLQLTMHEFFVYPKAGETVKQVINIPSDVFFVYAVNTSSTTVDQLVINNSLPTEMNTVINIPNNGNKIGCGYYPVMKNFTNIKALQSNGKNSEWSFNNIELTDSKNQTTTITIN